VTAVLHAPALETVTEPVAFAALEDGWDALVRAMPRPSPYLLHAWLAAWWRHHGEGGELRVHVARDGERLVAALPLYVSRHGGLRVLRFLGGGASALADVLLASDASPDLAARLVELAIATGGHDVADLFGLPGGSRLAAAAGRRLQVLERAEAPVLDLDGDWPSLYRRKTSGKRRNLDRRRRRRLGETGEVRIELARTWDTLAPALEAAFALHELRWRDRPDGSGFVTPVGRAFHRDALRAIAPLGVPLIVLVRLDGRPIACNCVLLLENRLYFHELAFDAEFARFSPGHICTMETLDAASRAGATRVEFLGGAERYKLDVADRFEPLHEGIGLATTVRGRAGARLRVAAIGMRRRAKHTVIRRIYYDHLTPARRAVRRLRS
jgi:CelD/BcsL family acetyltransferase involved in cellulose biosynthesis